MLGTLETTISTRSGSIGKDLTITVADGQIVQTGGNGVGDCCVHFSVPPSKWWNNVRFACATIQLFSSRSEAFAWSEKYGFYKGEVLDVKTLWELSKVHCTIRTKLSSKLTESWCIVLVS
jgi:hypothetical protein